MPMPTLVDPERPDEVGLEVGVAVPGIITMLVDLGDADAVDAELEM